MSQGQSKPPNGGAPLTDVAPQSRPVESREIDTGWFDEPDGVADRTAAAATPSESSGAVLDPTAVAPSRSPQGNAVGANADPRDQPTTASSGEQLPTELAAREPEPQGQPAQQEHKTQRQERKTQQQERKTSSVMPQSLAPVVLRHAGTSSMVPPSVEPKSILDKTTAAGDVGTAEPRHDAAVAAASSDKASSDKPNDRVPRIKRNHLVTAAVALMAALAFIVWPRQLSKPRSSTAVPNVQLLPNNVPLPMEQAAPPKPPSTESDPSGVASAEPTQPDPSPSPESASSLTGAGATPVASTGGAAAESVTSTGGAAAEGSALPTGSSASPKTEDSNSFADAFAKTAAKKDAKWADVKARPGKGDAASTKTTTRKAPTSKPAPPAAADPMDVLKRLEEARKAKRQ